MVRIRRSANIYERIKPVLGFLCMGILYVIWKCIYYNGLHGYSQLHTMKAIIRFYGSRIKNLKRLIVGWIMWEFCYFCQQIGSRRLKWEFQTKMRTLLWMNNQELAPKFIRIWVDFTAWLWSTSQLSSLEH